MSFVPVVSRPNGSEMLRASDQCESSLPASSTTTTPWVNTVIEINELDHNTRSFLINRAIQEDIEQCSGTKITTCGQYLTPEDKNPGSVRSLHLFIKGPNKDNLDAAVDQIEVYIQQGKYISMSKNLACKPKVRNDAKVEKVFVGFDILPSNALKNIIQGLNGTNLKYIMNNTGAIVTMRGHDSGFIEENGQESVEPLHIRIEHEDYEILQKGKWLAKYLIDTIKYNLTLSYTDNHLVSQFNVDNQPNNTSFQPLNAYSASTQSIIGHTQQINPGNYQIVQDAGNTLGLENRSHTVPISVANDKIQNSGHYQVTINPEIPIQVANQNQQHQLPFFITLNNLKNVQCTPPVTFTVPSSSVNDVTPYSKAFMTQSTLPIQYIRTPNDQIITYQTSTQSNAFGIVQTPQSSQPNPSANSGLIGMPNIVNNQFIQYQQLSDELGQSRIFPLPSSRTQNSTVQVTHLQQIQSGQFIPAITSYGKLPLQQMVDQPNQIPTLVLQQNQFHNLQPQIMHNYSDEIQAQVINQANIQQLMHKYDGESFTQQTTLTNNQLIPLPISYQILQPHENRIIRESIPQQQQLGLQNQQIQTHITDQQVIHNQENNYQQSVLYNQLLPTFNQSLDPSYMNAINRLNIGETSEAELVQAGPPSNDRSDQILQMTADNIVATCPEKHASSIVLKNQAPTGDGLLNNCLNINTQDNIYMHGDQNM